MLPDNPNHDPSFHYPHYYNRAQAIDVDALAAGVQRHMPPSQAYINLPGVDPATVDFRTFPYNPSEVKHRKRTTRPQQKVLEDTFKRETKPNASLRKTLAAELGMTPRGVQVWFQNRRAKEKALAKKARSGDKKSHSNDGPEDLEHEREDTENSPATAASTIGSDSPSATDPPLTQSPDSFPEPQLPSPVETVAATNTDEEKAPKHESGLSPTGLGLSRTSWQSSPPHTTTELSRTPMENTPPPPTEDESLVNSIRRGSLPVDIGSSNYPPTHSTFRVRSSGGGVGGSLGPGGMVGFDQYARRRSLDRLASHPYAHLAVAANGAVFGPSRGQHRLAVSSRNQSPSSTPQPHRPDLPPSYNAGGPNDQHRRPELMHRASMPAEVLGPVRAYDFPSNAYRMRFPQEGHVYALSSRTYQPPVPGPLPEPDFSFGTSTSAAPATTDGEGDLAPFHFPRERDLDADTEDGSAASYDAFSRFGSIASVADSESSATSAYYSEVGSFEMRPSTSNSHQRCAFDQDGRRLSCASAGQFLDMFSGLDVDNNRPNITVEPAAAADKQAGSGPGESNAGDGAATSPCGSPSSTVSGGSDHRRTGDSSLPISQTSELAFALQHVPERQDDGSNGGDHSTPDASKTNSEGGATPYTLGHGSSSSLRYPLSASSSSSSLGLPHPHLGLEIPDKFVFDNGIEVVSGTGHYSPVDPPPTFDTFPPLPMEVHMQQTHCHPQMSTLPHLQPSHNQPPHSHYQYGRGGEDDCIQLHDAMEYSMCPPVHPDVPRLGINLGVNSINVDVSHYTTYYN